MTLLSIPECALGWVQAYNSRSLDALMQWYDEDAVNTQHPWGKAVHGIAAIRETYARTFSCFPDIALSVDALIADRSNAAIRWEFSGTMHGEFAGHPPTRRRFQLRGCETLRFFAGRIVEQAGYWDRNTMFHQLGLSGA